MLTVDYHVHTPMCGHAEGEPLEYVKVAKAKGLRAIGFSDHVILHVDRREYSMPLSMIGEYLAMVKEAKRLSRPLGCEVCVGVEVDYADEKEGEIRDLLGKYPFDYVLGSVHSLGNWFFDDPRYLYRYAKVDLEGLYRDYFRALQRAAESRLFDVMAHPDIVKKFGFKPSLDLRALYAEAAEAFRRARVCVEVNTSGLRKPVREIYPSKEFLEMCLEDAIPVTIGSDAHSPREVGMGFDKAEALLKEVGYEEITIFSRRDRRALRIAGRNSKPRNL